MQSEYLVILMSTITLIISVIIFAFKVCFKSKCSDISLCFGLIKVHRNTIEEDKNVSMTEIASPSRVNGLV